MPTRHSIVAANLRREREVDIDQPFGGGSEGNYQVENAKRGGTVEGWRLAGGGE
jgi:hypothetical protein